MKDRDTYEKLFDVATPTSSIIAYLYGVRKNFPSYLIDTFSNAVLSTLLNSVRSFLKNMYLFILITRVTTTNTRMSNYN